MFDVLIPKNNEQELLEKAIKLKYKEIILLTDKIDYKLSAPTNNIKIKTAFFLKNPADFHKARKKFDFIFSYPERKFFEMKIDYVLGLETSDKKDSFHYKQSPLNQVTAKLCYENNIKLAFDFSLVNDKIALGRMIQNSVLIRKYKLDFDCFSFASSPSEMHSKNEMKSLFGVLGLKIRKKK